MRVDKSKTTAKNALVFLHGTHPKNGSDGTHTFKTVFRIVGGDSPNRVNVCFEGCRERLCNHILGTPHPNNIRLVVFHPDIVPITNKWIRDIQNVTNEAFEAVSLQPPAYKRLTDVPWAGTCDDAIEFATTYEKQMCVWEYPNTYSHPLFTGLIVILSRMPEYHTKLMTLSPVMAKKTKKLFRAPFSTTLQGLLRHRLMVAREPLHDMSKVRSFFNSAGLPAEIDIFNNLSPHYMRILKQVVEHEIVKKGRAKAPTIRSLVLHNSFQLEKPLFAPNGAFNY